MPKPENMITQNVPEAEPFYIEGVSFMRLRFPDEPRSLTFIEALEQEAQTAPVGDNIEPLEP